MLIINHQDYQNIWQRQLLDKGTEDFTQYRLQQQRDTSDIGEQKNRNDLLYITLNI